LQTNQRGLIRSMMPVVLVGVALALVALLGLRWPTSAAFDADYGPQFLRIVRGLAGDSPRGIAGVVVDSSVYVLIVVAIVLAGLTIVRGQREFLGTLVVTGLLGVAYCTGMVLYVGPMVATSAFMIVSLASLMTWLATGASEDADDTVADGTTYHHGGSVIAAAPMLAVAASDVPELAPDNEALQPPTVDDIVDDSAIASVDYNQPATLADAMPLDLPAQG
jgi:hypothetical protein